MTTKAAMFLTRETPEEIIEQGGTLAWKLNASRLIECEYVILCANSKGTAREPIHRSAFMIGKISGVQTSPGGRYKVLFSEYAADVLVPGVWSPEWRNPVRYEAPETVDIVGSNFNEVSTAKFESKGLSIEEAKAGIAYRYGKTVSDIEIIIK